MREQLSFQRVGWLSLVVSPGVLEPLRLVEMVQKRMLHSGIPLYLLVEHKD